MYKRQVQAQARERVVDDGRDLGLVQNIERTVADDVDIRLIKLAEAAALRALAAIDLSDLETAERESEVSAAGKNREKKLVKAYEKFNSAAVPERKECNVGKIVKELRKERVAVENMKAGEWHSLMKGKAVQPPLVSGASKAAGKGSALMLARTPAGYALKAAGAINQAGRQANAEM